MLGLIFDPPLTLQECNVTGLEFGRTFARKSRAEFEIALVNRLAVLSDLMVAAGTELNAEEAVAAFDRAAWEAWEAARDKSA